MRRLLLSAALLPAALLLATPARADVTSPADGFPVWLQNYKAGAVARGLKPEWLDATLSNATYSARAVQLDRNQPDDSGRRNIFADYLGRQLTQQRIDDGLTRARANRDTLLKVSRQTGVPPEIIVAIWGMETSYGRVMGGFDLPSAIATLAYDGRREALFTRELDSLVRMVGEGRVSRDQLKGSWAGAFGQSQFLPSSYLAYAADGDGDGKADIWNSTADTFMSIGNYLAKNGWKPGVPWGFRVGVPQGFDRATVANPVKPTSCIRPLERHSVWLPARDWKAKGFVPLNAVWPADDVEMSLIEPDGAGEGAFLATRSYRAIMEYNCSNFYALSVALLGNALQPAFR
ncbi:lytic murein transglycosylase [Sandaracinobacter sp. RS1-74]|uniref:lytic murein transglycosylase n=1 Tax=Sandaracinobacteroides sayramensis TaxID=2913411 RepID=UPI001EDAEFA0|nr:lytic murein transglycosylase [Sandaracinobacteroides sayramensis]MCG2842609.1 lytic murein transglycosylase [Sandaracinobacteroides sayramensis]